ncbi:hypothetical protein F5880DRAFT_1677314 [Lentinula raphanica]|nr:hypothetical protein F5880DRAFT_1677314 [Lentinula raphanica]
MTHTWDDKMRFVLGIMTLSNNIDNGRKRTIIQDQEGKCTICFGGVSQKTSEPGTFFLMYRRGTHDSPSFNTVKWVQEVMMTQEPLGGRFRATPEEQKLLLAVLNVNARRISRDYFVQVKQHLSGTEAPLALSFLLPIGPINQLVLLWTECKKQMDYGLSAWLGNIVELSLIPPEQIECQRPHWKEHKPTCNSLQGGEWIELGAKMAFWNSMASGPAKNILNYKPLKTEPAFLPNLHAQNPFLTRYKEGCIRVSRR